MSENSLCPHCGGLLVAEREKVIGCCFYCKRIGLLLGHWPGKWSIKMRNLTDEQIARVFTLCEEIAEVKKELPLAPQGFDLQIEMANALRVSLEQHAESLVELGQLLAPAVSQSE